MGGGLQVLVERWKKRDTRCSTTRCATRDQLPRLRLLRCPRHGVALPVVPRNDVGGDPAIRAFWAGVGRLRKTSVQNKANLRRDGCVLTVVETGSYAIDAQDRPLQKQSQFARQGSARFEVSSAESKRPDARPSDFKLHTSHLKLPAKRLTASLRAGPMRAEQSQFAAGRGDATLRDRKGLGKKRPMAALKKTKPILSVPVPCPCPAGILGSTAGHPIIPAIPKTCGFEAATQARRCGQGRCPSPRWEGERTCQNGQGRVCCWARFVTKKQG
jgi:hypothetical protein